MDIREKLVEFVHDARMNALWHNAQKPDEYIVDMLMANGVTVQEWISVKDRLPEKSGEYLTYCGDYDGVCVLYYEVLKTKGKWRTRWKKVTHWMPLPTPPKGVSEEALPVADEATERSVAVEKTEESASPKVLSGTANWR